MWLGVGLGISACVFWGLSYLIPLFLPEYSAWLISIGRTVVTGLAAAVLLFCQREYLRKVTFGDWRTALALSLVGNLIQPWCLFTAVQYAGVALASTFFGLIPVTVALIANARDKRRGRPFVPAARLAAPLAVIFCGLILSNWDGLTESLASDRTFSDFLIGSLYAAASTALWTWYPIRNADWLQEHKDVSSVFFSSMQFLALFPVGIALFAAEFLRSGPDAALGPAPLRYIFWMLVAGLLCSYLAAALWNAMSKRVPTALVGPMLVFETLFSVVFAHFYSRTRPSPVLTSGMILLLGGVVYTLRIFDSPAASARS
jgi:drug/metabolite transporter (DMT)-like permease